jgi:hypothetical protein
MNFSHSNWVRVPLIRINFHFTVTDLGMGAPNVNNGSKLF